ncbi:hypothetical protein EIP86_005055 [Pleurotus ostreatoroseus]|nr:hypothetical protein EIP86_005055 [Pleurotus ostreatoroseus]
MEEIRAAEIRGFEPDPLLATKHGVHTSAGIQDGYKYAAPAIDTDAYMFWMRELVASKGCQFVTAHVTGSLLEQEDKLLKQHGANIIVNCAGLGSAELAADTTVYPLRGALIRVVNDGRRFPVVTQALVVAHDVKKREEDGGIVFIVPRNDCTLILGGIAQPHKHSLHLTVDSPEIRRMYDRCVRFVPGLASARLDPETPLVQGLRPSRLDNVRVERETGRKNGAYSNIIHSYGHGGSGFTLSFGCASDVLGLVREIEAGIPPTPV